MPKVKLGRPNYEAIFGAELKASVMKKRLKCGDVANKIGCAPRTISNRFNEPSFMTLGQLKLFIKITDLPPEVIIQYLYEKQ